MQALTSLFWEQLDLLRPESYIADGDYLNIASANKQVVETMCEALVPGVKALPCALLHHPTLHHKIHFLQYRDVLQGIARHRHNVGLLANFNRPDLVLHPKQL